MGVVAPSYDATAKMNDVQILAFTIGGEVRGEDRRCQFAVGNIISNRLKAAKKIQRYLAEGETVERLSEALKLDIVLIEQCATMAEMRDVCLMPGAFGCWQDGSIGRKWIDRAAQLDLVHSERRLMAQLMYLAEGWLMGVWMDELEGADHYHCSLKTPEWAERRELITLVGPLRLYRLFKI